MKKVLTGLCNNISQNIGKIKVWSKSEFDKVDSLFFRLGYTCFLEWGHSKYISSKTKKYLRISFYSFFCIKSL